MLISMWYCIIIFFCYSTLKGVYAQNIIGRNCTLEISGSPGKCKLLMKCKQIRDELIQYNRLPQACGFQETQAIVCCPREPGELSEEKCQEYSSRRNKNGHNIVKRIVGGKKASRKEFPHMALLGGENKSGVILWMCGGTIISEKYILTAAQCFKGHYEVKFVRVGFTNLDDHYHRQEIKVFETKAYPNHEMGIAYNDVGLVKLEKAIQFNSYASPACLFTRFQVPNKKAIATGWGITEEHFGFNSKDLVKVTLELADYEFCNSEYKKITDPSSLRRGLIHEEQICVRTVADNNNTKDTCKGDAGGPLQIYDSYLEMYKVIGVISFGSQYCDGNLPPVCTRVSHYIKWIENIVWSDSDEIELAEDSVEDIIWPN